MSDTIAAIATGAQIAAIGIIRLSGPESLNIIDKVFFPARGGLMSQSEDRKLMYGRLCTLDGELLDLCLCTVSRAPNSYTGENTAELQCHGSPVVLRTALEQLFALGARQAGPGEFTKRAFLNGRLELSAAEAVADIIDAESIEAARNAAGQLSGAVGRRIERVYSLFTDISSHYHAVLDYPDEDIEDFRMAAYLEDMCKARAELSGLLSTFDRGRLITGGVPAAIVGKPNAGKSSLLNALLGYERAIVTDIPGTTRDTIEEKLRLGSLTLRLTDTAGIHETEDVVERMGVERSRQAMKNAMLVLVVIDGSCVPDEEDQALIRQAEKAEKAILVVSKNDLDTAFTLVSTLPTVSVSAVTGDGLDELERLVNELFPMPQVPAGEILTNARQAEAVKRALEHLDAALSAMEYGMTPDVVLTEAEGVMHSLGELTGRSIREDVTNRIFQRFCVGK